MMLTVKSLKALDPGSNRALTILAWLSICTLAFLRFAAISQDRTFQYDEWNFVMNRWQFTLDTFLQPHNSHLSIFHAAIFLFLFRLVGLANYGIYQMAGYLAHISVATILVVLIARRLGRVAAVALGVSILLLGTGAENILWPFQIGSMASLAGYLLALNMLDNGDSRKGTAVCVALIVSLGSAGFGIAATIGITAELAVAKKLRRMWWVVVIPSVAWFSWYMFYGSNDIDLANLGNVIPYINESLAATLAGYFHLSIGWGFLFEAFLLIGSIRAVVVARHVTPRTVGLAATVGAFWFFTALSRAQFWQPASSRYLYMAIPLLLLVVVELAQRVPRQITLTAVLIIGLWSVTSTWNAMDAHAQWLREWSSIVRAELSAIESRGKSVDAQYRPDPIRAPDITARKFFRAVNALESSPAQDPSTLITSSAPARAEVDRVLLEIGAVIVTPPTDTTSGCSNERQPADEIILPTTTVIIVSPDGDTEVGFKSFGDSASEILRTALPAGQGLAVTTSRSLPAEQWTVISLTLGQRVCLASSSG